MLWRRWMIFGLLVPAYMVVMIVIGTVLLALVFADWSNDSLLDVGESIVEVLLDEEWWSVAGPVAFVGTALQAIFLIPVFGRTPPRGERARSLNASLIFAALIAALLMAGLAFGVTDLISALLIGEDPADKGPALWLVILFTLLGGWGLWTFVLLVYVRDIWPDRLLGRMVGVLLGGTALELLVVLPIDVMVRRRTDCYCATGTFFGLIIATAAVLWLAGPGIVIALVSTRHRRWRTTHCGRCGYPKGPSPSGQCPECGYAW